MVQPESGGAVRLYVDSADDEVVGRLLVAGVVRGVTTNPTVLERAGRTRAELPAMYRRWVAAGAEEVFFQAWGPDEEALRARAEELLAIGDRVAVKVPATRPGFAAAAHLAAGGAPVLVTAVYTVEQALAAAAVGARYIAPYLGRLADAGLDAAEVIGRMAGVCRGTATEVLAASLREPAQITLLRERGIGAFTARPEVLWAMLDSDRTTAATAEFEAAMGRVDTPGGVSGAEDSR